MIVLVIEISSLICDCDFKPLYVGRREMMITVPHNHLFTLHT